MHLASAVLLLIPEQDGALPAIQQFKHAVTSAQRRRPWFHWWVAGGSPVMMCIRLFGCVFSFSFQTAMAHTFLSESYRRFLASRGTAVIGLNRSGFNHSRVQSMSYTARCSCVLKLHMWCTSLHAMNRPKVTDQMWWPSARKRYRKLPTK